MGNEEEDLQSGIVEGGEVEELVAPGRADSALGATYVEVRGDIGVLGAGEVPAESLRDIEASWHDPGRCFLIVEDDFEAGEDILGGISVKVGDGASARVELAMNLDEVAPALARLLSNPGVNTLTLVLDRALPQSEDSIAKEENGPNALRQIMGATESAGVRLEVLVGSNQPAALPEFRKICPDAVIGQVFRKEGAYVVAMLEGHWRSQISS